MNYKVTIANGVAPVMRAAQAALMPEVINKTLARGAERLFRDHIGSLPTNRIGKSTGFWADAARSTHAEATGTGCVVSVSKLGFRQRYYGGTIKPVNAKYLTIPARSEFYGARARQFTNLRFVMFGSGTAALVIGEGGAEKITGVNSSKRVGGKQSAGMVAFWLVDEVNQKPNPTIIPEDSAILDMAEDVARQALTVASRQ